MITETELHVFFINIGNFRFKLGYA